ncbi:DUF2092 domain-containing protein [Geminocystis sp. GBBB08]|uniref:DUF2092 domain-containing protein n=1 Tax=Geminocystis sp. GBBB08 TaxID=2604140 RepID=UPI0027E30EE1|nr:DUF2092 domain-containing protein [Geminocystis sp. GBBB08]MBL1210575.1 DUF2092 domain-containing protein [Geminocystis sp. GBBB08]
MNYLRTLLILTFCVTFSLGLVPKIQAQNNPGTSTATEETSITTEELLNQVCDFLKSQQSLSVEMDITYDNVLTSGAKVQYSGYKKVSVQRPNMVRVDTVADEGNRNFYYDGKSFTLFSPDLKVFATKEAPANIDEMLNTIEEKFGFTIPMFNLFTSNPCAVLDDMVGEPLYIGSNLVNREETDQILIVTKDWDGQLWISQDEPLLVKKAIVTYKNLPHAPQYTVLFSNWNFKPSFAPDTFTFIPAKDDFRVQILPTSPEP